MVAVALQIHRQVQIPRQKLQQQQLSHAKHPAAHVQLVQTAVLDSAYEVFVLLLPQLLRQTADPKAEPACTQIVVIMELAPFVVLQAVHATQGMHAVKHVQQIHQLQLQHQNAADTLKHAVEETHVIHLPLSCPAWVVNVYTQKQEI